MNTRSLLLAYDRINKNKSYISSRWDEQSFQYVYKIEDEDPWCDDYIDEARRWRTHIRKDALDALRYVDDNLPHIRSWVEKKPPVLPDKYEVGDINILFGEGGAEV